jgi:hypothetical protein
MIITLVFEKNVKIFAKNCQKSQKIVIITLVPDWANYRILGDCFLWEVLCKNIAVVFFITRFHGKSYVLILTKSGLGYVLGDFFSGSPGHPGRGGGTSLVNWGGTIRIKLRTENCGNFIKQNTTSFMTDPICC